jgi:hypothetical protein
MALFDVLLPAQIATANVASGQASGPSPVGAVSTFAGGVGAIAALSPPG